MAKDGLGVMTEGFLSDEEIPLNLAKRFRYTIRYNVAVRVSSKLRFQVDATLDPSKGETPLYLLDQTIREAESALDRALSARYTVPLAADYDAFLLLAETTQDAIRPLVDAHAASALLAIEFGSHGPIKADEFQDTLRKYFDDGIEALLNRKQKPLAGLALLDAVTDDARPTSVLLDNRGANTGLQGETMDGVYHPVDTVAWRLPRSDLEI